jgi:hypothetical protein
LLDVGGTALLHRALNFSVSKDNFWTTGPYQPNRTNTHPYPEAHTMVAVLACGTEHGAFAYLAFSELLIPLTSQTAR